MTQERVTLGDGSVENDLMCPGAGATVLRQAQLLWRWSALQPQLPAHTCCVLGPGPRMETGGKQTVCPRHGGESGAPSWETVQADYRGVSDRAMGGGAEKWAWSAAGRGRRGLAGRRRQGSFLCRVRRRGAGARALDPCPWT